MNNKNKKTTCHDGCTASSKRVCGHGKNTKTTNQGKWSHSLSESCNQTYGITPPNTTTSSLCSGLQPIDYLTLNDGFDDETAVNPKRRKRITYRPRSAPSATRVATQKHTTSPEAKNVTKNSSKQTDGTLSGVPSTTAAHATADPDLTGVPGADNTNKLPDLVLNREILNLEMENTKTVDPVSMEEELEVADALLSLGEVHDDTLEDDDNSQLMPVGAPSQIVDAAPVTVRLDQINVDNAIADIIQSEELEKQEENVLIPAPDDNSNDEVTTNTADTGDNTTTSAAVDDAASRPKSASPTQGSLKITRKPVGFMQSCVNFKTAFDYLLMLTIFHVQKLLIILD